MKLYYLYNKITKKIRSLQEFIDKLDSLVDLRDNFILGNGVAPKTRWIGYLVKALQHAMDKF